LYLLAWFKTSTQLIRSTAAAAAAGGGDANSVDDASEFDVVATYHPRHLLLSSLEPANTATKFVLYVYVGRY